MSPLPSARLKPTPGHHTHHAVDLVQLLLNVLGSGLEVRDRLLVGPEYRTDHKDIRADNGLTTLAREDVRRLRRENSRLGEARAMLTEAAAGFARATNSCRSPTSARCRLGQDSYTWR